MLLKYMNVDRKRGTPTKSWMDSVKDDMGMKEVTTEIIADRERRKNHTWRPHMMWDKGLHRLPDITGAVIER